MGQSQSNEKGPGSRSGTPNDRVSRRRSVHPAPGVRGRATPVQASATPETARGQTLQTEHLQTPQLQQIVQSTSPEPSSRNNIGRSTSTRERRNEGQPRPEPVNVPAPSGPMNVPSARSKGSSEEKSYDRSHHVHEQRDDFEHNRYVSPARHRPPRLPLPIADAGPVPDSPVLAPVDKGNAEADVFPEPLSAIDPLLKRQSSMISTATQDEGDEETAAEELPPIDPAAQTIPFVVEWNRPSTSKVYVTGTFVSWEKKLRMHHK